MKNGTATREAIKASKIRRKHKGLNHLQEVLEGLAEFEPKFCDALELLLDSVEVKTETLKRIDAIIKDPGPPPEPPI